MSTQAPDRLDLRVKLMLAIVGAVLCVVAWVRFLS
jgi:hypothetical protein